MRPRSTVDRVAFECLECGKLFTKSRKVLEMGRSDEVLCPKCKSPDVDLDSANLSGRFEGLDR